MFRLGSGGEGRISQFGVAAFEQHSDVVVGQGQLATPIDPTSGNPLSLSPYYMEERPTRYKSDRHHPWHESTHPVFQTISGRALRGCRVQTAVYEAHHIDYHGENFRGPELPENPADHLKPLVFAQIGHVPSQALGFTASGTPYIEELSNKTRAKLISDGAIRVERRDHMRTYFRGLLLEQEVTDMDGGLLDEFVHTPDQTTFKVIGDQIVRHAAQKATEPISEGYRQAYLRRDLPFGCPRTAATAVLSALRVRGDRAQLYEGFRDQLLGQMTDRSDEIAS